MLIKHDPNKRQENRRPSFLLRQFSALGLRDVNGVQHAVGDGEQRSRAYMRASPDWHKHRSIAGRGDDSGND